MSDALLSTSDVGDVDTPGFVVFDAPFLLTPTSFAERTHRPAKRILLPVLAVRAAGGAVVVPDETLSWARHLANKEVPSFQIRRRLSAVGRLHEFAETVAADRMSQPGAMDLLVWEHLRRRVENPVDPGARLFEHWRPVQYKVVRTEFRDLVDYGRYCAGYTGPTSVMGSAFKAGSEIWMKMDRSLPADRLLSHLEAQRARWHALLGDDTPTPPSGLKRLATTVGKQESASDTTLSIDAVDTIIDRERTPMLKALWTELAYLGPRISEPLNHWRCDVLDASYSQVLFGAPVEGPLVIFAHPIHSRYTGPFDSGLRTREQELKQRYGLVPRPDEASKKQRIGWKGMAAFNPELWITHGTWTCRKRASEFNELFAEILDLHGALGTDAMHPYLYVNSKNAAHLGEPLKIGNVEEAFERACIRAGVKPHSPGAHLHGLRHFYRWYATHKLKLPEDIVQLMMRQRSVTSQRVYGKRFSDAYDAMASLHDRDPLSMTAESGPFFFM